jgi:electron transport protein HydN
VVERYDGSLLGGLTVGAAPKAAVIKCDRCYDRPEGPACIQACTSLALRLIDQDEIEARQSTRQSALAAEMAQ